MKPLTTRGFHHITMVSTNARRTLAFYQDLLGLGLVKKTVNFDDPGAYHLYFGNDGGRPGTILTFFEWPRSPSGHWGVGGVHHLVEFEAQELVGPVVRFAEVGAHDAAHDHGAPRLHLLGLQFSFLLLVGAGAIGVRAVVGRQGLPGSKVVQARFGVALEPEPRVIGADW